MVQTWTLRWNEQKRLEAFKMWTWRRMEHVTMDTQNKKCRYARKSGRRKNNASTDKEEEKKLAGLLAKKKLPAEGCNKRDGKREESSWHRKISDDRQQYGK